MTFEIERPDPIEPEKGTSATATAEAPDDGPEESPEPSEAASPNIHFSDGVEKALGDPALQMKLKAILGILRQGRQNVIPPDSPTDTIRQRGKLIRAEVIAHLDEYLREFIQNAEKRGVHVHLARTSADARRIVQKIAKDNNVRSITKGKSMVSEEVHLREALQEDGIEVTETDLGELMVQLADEMPSHLIAPAIHMNMAQMADVLQVTSEDGTPLPAEAKVLMAASRKWLRSRFMRADMGITGANFGIADTGTFFIVTNEGNGRMTSTVPRIHVAMMGIERLLPTLESMGTILQLLTRSATNQQISVYVSMFGGPRAKGELAGPEEQHIVLVDNGRSRLLGTEFAESLECIRCGMCQAACPIYERAGGHSYQSVYSGPIGKIVTPLYGNSPVENELPHASSLCGACKEVCPVDIDIPRMLIKLRTHRKFEGPMGRWESLAIRIGGKVLSSPGLYGFASWVGRRAQKLRVEDGWISKAPGPLGEWTINRDLPALAPKSFRERWKQRTDKR